MDSKIALVTGASRGVGRGIAIGLGESGWTVWVTARSSRAEGSSSHLAGTVEDCAEAVTAAGGRGVPVRCDHSDDGQVSALVHRLSQEQGRLDLLVNNVWGGYERLNAGAWEEWTSPFWQQPRELWDAMQARGVRAHYVSTALLSPLLIASAPALVVTVGMRSNDAQANVAYAVAKAADNELAVALDRELREQRVRSLALHPGLVRTEGVMQFAEFLDLSASEAPEDVGRVIAALAADPDRARWAGGAHAVSDLATHYGVPLSAWTSAADHGAAGK